MRKLIITFFAILSIVTSVSCKDKKTKIIFMGDSITDGNWGGGNGNADKRNKTDYNHIYGHGFMEMIAGYYMSKYPKSNYEFQNRGISGYRLQDLEKRWNKDVVEEKPDVLSILIGTNDVWFYLREHDDDNEFQYEKWDSTYRNLLDRAIIANPSIRIILCSPFVVKTGTIGEMENWELRKKIVDNLTVIISKIALDYKATYVPYDKLFAELSLVRNIPSDYWSWDAIHPTTQGHYKMAKLWIKKVRRIY